MLPNKNATRLKLKKPISPQFIAPMMEIVSAVQSIALLFMPFPPYRSKSAQKEGNYTLTMSGHERRNYNSMVSIMAFKESAECLSFTASSSFRLMGMSASTPSAPTMTGMLNETPSMP